MVPLSGPIILVLLFHLRTITSTSIACWPRISWLDSRSHWFVANTSNRFNYSVKMLVKVTQGLSMTRKVVVPNLADETVHIPHLLRPNDGIPAMSMTHDSCHHDACSL